MSPDTITVLRSSKEGAGGKLGRRVIMAGEYHTKAAWYRPCELAWLHACPGRRGGHCGAVSSLPSGRPRIPGLELGVALSQANAQLAKEVLPEEILRLLTAGDFSITIQETTDLPPRPSYLEATRQYSHEVTFNGGRNLQNYRAGTPFPLLDPADPQAGEKLAWNLRYRDLGEAFELKAYPRQLNASGGVEHSNRGHMRLRFGMYRPNPADNDRQWQAQGILMKNSFELLAPSDQEGNLNLRTFYDDDTRATEQWRYSPQNRRTRKDYVNYVTPIGGYYEMLQEEQPPLFFQGYLHDYDWMFRGARVMLVPGFLKTTALDYGGKNGWYPQVPWELRHVLVLECTPRHSHPFGRRVFFLDQQTYTPLLTLTYTPTGAFVRLTVTAHAHPSVHPGNNGVPLPMLVGAVWINYGKERATLFDVGDSMIYNPPLATQRFELMEILRKGK
jgi:hypothetical protein